MNPRHLERLKGLVQFAILWLLVVHLVDLLRGAALQLGGLLVVLIASLVVTYCKWRAQRGLAIVERPRTYYFWLYLPSLPAVLSVGGIIWKLTHPATERRTFGTLFWDLLPVVLQLGVPVVVLAWAYVLLARIKPLAIAAAPSPLAPVPDHRPPTPE